MASLLKIAALFVAAFAMVSTTTEAASSTETAVIYTTGGQGFHRQLLMHVPLTPSASNDASSSSGSATFSVTLHMRLRNTFFIDVAEAENLWDAKLLTSTSSPSSSSEEQLTTAVSRGGNGFITAVALQHPITTIYPYDIEIPTVKTPYLFNEANVTFDFTVDKAKLASSSSGSSSVLAVLSIPIHERYEDVTTDPSVTHVTRCVEAADVKIYVNNNAEKAPKHVGKQTDKAVAQQFKHLESLPIKFTQSEDTAAIISNTEGLKDSFCVNVPVGYLGDLPYFYWATMSCMVLGAIAVWAGLSTV